MARVVFDNVSKRFDDDSLALQNFSLTIEDGEMVVLVGPSGCGKSTALRILAGLEHVSAGDIIINDRVVNHTTPQQRNVAMVFQNYALYPHMSVRANLEFPLRMAHVSTDSIKEKVAAIADILNLSELLERRPNQLSGGQRQRVAMGRALVRDPSVFLLDEPLSNLDAKLRAQIRADIARLQQRLHKTTLYVTHDQVEAMTLGDRVAVMNAGNIQQVGTPDELYQHPHNTFVAKFIGSPGMNIIPSVVLDKSEQGIKVAIGKQEIDLSRLCHGNDAAIKQYTGREIYLGIRPEAFTCSAEAGCAAIRIKTESVEFLGHESLVYFRLAETGDNQPDITLIARIAGKLDDSSRSEEVFYTKPGSLYLFDNSGHVIG
ncbi:MAG: sn-glycerol-3-phosphate ABC transporter ATP-binding protein UgpC [Gammaproteobacteria bacterium]|jgi:multiple sugar transport system ATP-binding protein